LSTSGDIPMIYSVTVQYGRQNRQNLISAGAYSRIDKAIYWPTWNRIVCSEDGISYYHKAFDTGEATLFGEIYISEERIDGDGMIKHLHSKKMRGATVEEILAFGSQYPEIQRQFPVVAVGGVLDCSHDAQMEMVVLDNNASGRTIETIWTAGGDKFLIGTHFLVFPDDRGYFEI